MYKICIKLHFTKNSFNLIIIQQNENLHILDPELYWYLVPIYEYDGQIIGRGLC